MKLARSLFLGLLVISACSDRAVGPGDSGPDRTIAPDRVLPDTPKLDHGASWEGGRPDRGFGERLLGDRASSDQFNPPPTPYDVDMLFVIDNSNSMETKQTALAAQFPKLIEALRSPKLGPAAPGASCSTADPSGCKLPNLHIGVVTTDLGAGNFSFQTCEIPGGDGGKLQSGPGALSPPGCPTPTDPWISYWGNSSGAVVNVQNAKSTDPAEQVKEAFSCIAMLGTGGCGFEHQLESAHRALMNTTNPGFLRPSSVLVVVFLTDEDDCSAQNGQLFDPSQQGLGDPLGPLNSFRCTEFGLVCDEPMRAVGVKHNCVPGGSFLYPVAGYVSFFQGLRPNGKLLVAAIDGPPSPVEVGLDGSNPTLKASCSSTIGVGVPGIRLKAVMDGLGASGIYNQGVSGGVPIEVNICAADYSPVLQRIGDTISQWY